MKKLNRILSFLMAVVIFMSFSLSAYAEEDINAFISKIVSYYENIAGSDVGATGYMEKGVNESNQGWIIYGINKYGQVVSEPYIMV